MRTNRTWVRRMLRTAAILACILLPVSAIAAEPSCNEHLLLAAENGSGEQAKTLPAKGGDVNAQDEYGRTALMKAAERGNLEVVKFFIDKGLDVNAKDKNGQTAVSLASVYDHSQIVQHLKCSWREMILGNGLKLSGRILVSFRHESRADLTPSSAASS